MVELCPLTAAWLPALQMLDAECFGDEPFAPLWWHKAIDGQGACAWLAVRGQTLLGYALFSRVIDEAELLRIATAISARRQGVAQALLAHAQQVLAAAGVTRLFLEVRASNQPAQQLYRRLGWQPDGRRRDYYPLGAGREDALLFKRILSTQG